MNTEIPTIKPDEDWVSVTSKLAAHIRTFSKADAWWADTQKIQQTWNMLSEADLCYITKARYVMDAFLHTLDWKSIGVAHQISCVAASITVCSYRDVNKLATATA